MTQRNRFKILPLPSMRSCVTWMSAAAALSLVSCRMGRNFYVLEEIRVPALQSLQTFDAPVDGRHCFALNGETVCQQYPLRPAQKTSLRFLALAPSTTLPMTMAVTKLQRAKLPQLLTTSSNCDTVVQAVSKITNVDVPLSTLGIDNAQWNRQLKQESPLHIEEHVISFTAPAAEALLNEALTDGWLPLFTLEYEAQIPGSGLRTDRGTFVFTIVPEPQNNTGGNQNPPAGSDSTQCFARALAGNGTLATNTAPFIQSISPSVGTQAVGSPVDLQLTLSADDPDTDARRRVQWYLSRGELENQRAATTKLTFSGADPLTAVGVVRDLQGGVDFAWTTFTGK